MSAPGEPRPSDHERFALPSAGRKSAVFDTVFLGSQGVRAGWRAGLYVALVLVFKIILELPAALIGLPLQVDPRALTPGPLFLQEMILFASALSAAQVMALIEGRRIGAYGLPWRGAVRGRFWQGALWGWAEISVLVLLIGTLGGYTLGDVALRGGEAVRYAVQWALVCLMVGFAEEFAFRGYLLFTLSSGMDFWPAAVLLSLLFSAVHLGNPGENFMGVTGVFAIAMFFCLTVRRTGSLWFAIGQHATYNFGQAFVYSVPNSGTLIRGHLLDARLEGPQWLTGGAAGPEGSALAFVVLALMFVLFARVYRSPQAPQDAHG